MNFCGSLCLQDAAEHEDTRDYRCNSSHDRPSKPIPLLCEEGNTLYYGRTATASISTLYAGSANCWICTSVFAGGFDPRYFARTAATSGARNSEMLDT